MTSQFAIHTVPHAAALALDGAPPARYPPSLEKAFKGEFRDECLNEHWFVSGVEGP